MKIRYIVLSFGIFFLSINTAMAETLSANPWLRQNPVPKATLQVEPETLNYTERSAETAENPWIENRRTDSIATTGKRLRQNLEIAAENSKKSLQNLSEQANRLSELSSAVSPAQEENTLPNFVTQLSELMQAKHQTQPSTDSRFFNTETRSSLNGLRYNNNSNRPSLGEQASRTYRQTTDNIKRSLKSKYNAVQREFSPYTNAARNAVQSWEKNSGVSMEQIKKIMQ